MKHPIPDHNPMRGQYSAVGDRVPQHFALSVADGVATVTLNRPERKNPLTFDSYAELRDWFLALQKATDIKAVVLTGAGGNFCSGGDVHEIIGPLTKMSMPELLAFTRMTGALVSAMRAGVREVLNLPLVDGALGEAFKRCASHQSKLQASPDQVRPKGKMAAFVSCKGGNGASFVATNMAYLMASEFSKTCAFLDLDLQYGDASFYLGGGGVKNNISDLTQQIERLDGQLLLSCMHQVAPGLAPKALKIMAAGQKPVKLA